MAIGVIFKCLNIVFIKETSKQKRFAQPGSARNEIVVAEVIITFRYFNNKTVRPRFQSSRIIKYM